MSNEHELLPYLMSSFVWAKHLLLKLFESLKSLRFKKLEVKEKKKN